MTDKLTKYDECAECGYPRFFHTDGKENSKSTAELCGECSEFVPNQDGWVIVTRRAIICEICPDISNISLRPHDLGVVDPEKMPAPNVVLPPDTDPEDLP